MVKIRNRNKEIMRNQEFRERKTERERVNLAYQNLISNGVPDGPMNGTYPGIGVMGDLVEAVAEFTNDKLVAPFLILMKP